MRDKTKQKIWKILIGFIAVITILGMVAPMGFGLGF
jgi:uncharacterized membrane protein